MFMASGVTTVTFEEIQEMAKALGIASPSKFKTKEDLIRTIQLAEGYTDCCGEFDTCMERDCMWKDDCRELTAIKRAS